MLQALDSLLATGRRREVVEIVEHERPPELVAAKDITGLDGLGRTVVMVPAGMPPAHWVQLTDAERTALVPPKPPPPQGYLHPNGLGFTPEGVRVGFSLEATQ